MTAITFKGRHGCFKLTKEEKESKNVADHYSPIIDKVIEEALSQSFSSNFIDSFMSKLFSDESSFYESVRCAYLSTSTFQPAKFYKQLKKLLVERKKEKVNIKYYDSRPALNEVLGDVKKVPNEFVGIFNVSDAFDKKFFKKFVDLLLERSQKAVLIFVTMFNLGEESSLGFLGIPAYISSIFDQKNFVQHVQYGLLQTPLYPTTVEKELRLYDQFHRSDRILTRRLKLHLAKFATSTKEAKLCHLLKKLQYELGVDGKLETSLKSAFEDHDPEDPIKPYETFDEYLHKSGEKKSGELKGFLKVFNEVEKENYEEQHGIYNDMVELVCNEWVPVGYEKLRKNGRAVIEDSTEYPAQNVIDNLDQPELKDYKLVYEMIFDIAYENRPIPYREVLERFEAVKQDDVPEFLKKYPVEYYFRVILDSLAYCGIIERKADNPELIKFFPTPSYNLIKKQIQNCVME